MAEKGRERGESWITPNDKFIPEGKREKAGRFSLYGKGKKGETAPCQVPLS